VDFSQPEECEALRDSVRRFVAAEITPHIARYEASGEFPYQIIARMGEAGMFGATFPRSLGGTEAGFFPIVVISEEISRLAPEFGYAMNQQAMTCPFTILNWGTADQAARFVPNLISGTSIGMFGLSEPSGGSDPAGAIRTTARRDGSVYRINGSKQWITFANACDSGLLFARTDAAAGHRGITAFVVEPKRFPGYAARPIEMTGLSRCLRSCAVFFDDFPVPVENRLASDGDGFKIAMNALEYGRLTVAARLVGLAQAAFEHARDYARSRIIRGQPLASYQMVQHQVADMAVNIEAARLLTWKTAWAMERGLRSNRAAAYAKYFAGTAAKHAAQAAAEIFAGYALADEYPIKKITAYINMLSVGEGTPNVQRILIAEDALGIKDADRHIVSRGQGSKRD